MASYFWREIFYVPFPGTPGKIPGNSGSTELRKEFGTTLNRNMIYYDSIESYFSRKEPTLWRKIKFYSRFLILVIYTVKYGLLLLYPCTLQWTLLKDASIIFGKQANLPHALFFSIGMVTLMGKLVFAYYESRKNLYLFNFYIDSKSRKPLYQTSEKHLKMITLRGIIIYYGLIRIIGSIGFLLTILISS